MGFQDRDYYREGSEPGYVTSWVVKLIILNGVVFLAQIMAGWGPNESNPVTDWLGVHSDTIVKPWLWFQFLTAGFVHAEGLSHIFFNMVGLYCFGRRLEERYGRREFLRFYLAAIVVGFAIWSAAHYFPQHRLAIGYGASGGVTAVILLFCLLYPRETVLASFIFPIPAWLLGAIIVIGDIMGSKGNATLGVQIAYDVHLTGAVFALAYWYFGWNFGRLPGMSELKRLLALPKKWLKAKPPLRVHDPEQYYDDLDAQADRLLEKVHREGQGSLTDAERRILEDYSRRTRQKLR